MLTALTTRHFVTSVVDKSWTLGMALLGTALIVLVLLGTCVERWAEKPLFRP